MTRLLEDILHQPAALRSVARYQSSEGRDALERAARILNSGKQIIITGMGASFFAGMGFAYILAALGACVQAIEASELLYFLDSQIQRDVVIVLISRSGESIEVTKLLTTIRERQAAVIGVTNIPGSTLAKEAAQAILIASPPDELVAIQTYTATVAVLGFVTAALSGDVNTALYEVDIAAEALSAWIPECVAGRESWDTFLNLNGPCYLLGRGKSLATVSEGVLLMHETAKSPAVGMSAAQFRHGPVEAVDRDFHAVIVSTQAETAYLDAALADDLIAMSGTIRWLGPAVSSCQAPVLSLWPDAIPSRFYSLAETVPLQCLAYRKAELTGISPGKFRWAPLVTTTERGFTKPGDAPRP